MLIFSASLPGSALVLLIAQYEISKMITLLLANQN
jgi:hypothetical protein